MKINHIIEGVGKIVQGVNTTIDVKPGQTEKEAKKFFGGNGKPKSLTVTGVTPNQAFNMGLTESVKIGDTIKYYDRKGKEQTGVVAKKSTNSPKGYFLDDGTFVSKQSVLSEDNVNEARSVWKVQFKKNGGEWRTDNNAFNSEKEARAYGDKEGKLWGKDYEFRVREYTNKGTSHPGKYRWVEESVELEEADDSLPKSGPIETSQMPADIQQFLSKLVGVYWEKNGSANVIPYSAGFGYTFKGSAGAGNTGLGLVQMGLISDDDLYTSSGRPVEYYNFKLGNWDVSIHYNGPRHSQSMSVRFDKKKGQVEEDVMGPIAFAKDLWHSLTGKKRNAYQWAVEKMHEIISTKGADANHSVNWYADKIARQIPAQYNINVRTLIDLYDEKYGISEAGTIANEGDDPCWKGYKQLGMKKKGGKEVPNCVPVNENEITIEDADEIHGEFDNSLFEAEYQGRSVTLNKPMQGDVKKFKVYVKNDKGNVIKVNFGDPDMRIKKSNPARRKSFRARHKCDQKKDKTTAGYWSCKKW